MGKSAPKAPDPWQTASAQGAWNTFTAQQQQQMNMVGQNSPWGSLAYQQTGSTWITDPNGKRVEVPMYTANTTLTPEQQAIFDQTQQAEFNLAQVANTQSAKIGELLNDPFTYTPGDTENWAWDIASQRILPQQEQNRKALENQLANRGIVPGTAAYEREMQRLTNANTDQLNQLALTGHQMAFNEALAMRNQQFNEPIALMSGTQIQNPNATFAQTPQSQVAGVDYTGLVNQKYQADVAQYNSQMGALGGLFGGITGMFSFSDERLKEDIKRVGQTDAGIPVYTYRYKGDGTIHMGVMAQEVLKDNPDAVRMHESGYLMVDYGKVR